MTHYYGDMVRRLFLTAAFIMLAALPFVSALIGRPIFVSIIGILVLSVAAGLTSPLYAASAILDSLIALGALIIFESYAVAQSSAVGFSLFFWVNQVLALIFLFALYFGLKTFRNSRNVRAAADH